MTDETPFYPVELALPVVWGDMDAFGHVNNTVYLRWFESARMAYFHSLDMYVLQERTGISPILATTNCTFRIPVIFPDTIKAMTRIKSIGRTSFVMDYQITSEQHEGKVAAFGEGVIVMVDRGGKPIEVPPQLRESIQKFERHD